GYGTATNGMTPRSACSGKSDIARISVIGHRPQSGPGAPGTIQNNSGPPQGPAGQAVVGQGAADRLRGGALVSGILRREVVLLGGSAAATWPIAARAQQPGKLPTIGLLVPGTPASHGQWFAVLVQRLRELGWIEGRTVALEVRWAEGRIKELAEIATE